MPSEIDRLKALKGKKVVDFELIWDNTLDDYSLESITFEDGTMIELYGKDESVLWFVEGDDGSDILDDVA